MAIDRTLPGPREPLQDAAGFPTVPWRKFFERMASQPNLTVDQQAEIAALTARVGALEAAGVDLGSILGLGSVQVTGSLGAQVVAQLEGDEESPAASSYYGTDDTGVKGYRLIADGLGDCTTDDLPEGAANLYYTDTRADARVAAGIAAFQAAPSLGTLVNAANDAAAAAGGVPVGALYRNASALMIRIA